jgi:hypothetical protein
VGPSADRNLRRRLEPGFLHAEAICAGIRCRARGCRVARRGRAPFSAAIRTRCPRIKADVAEIVAGINSKDIDKATKYDAPDLA